MKVTNMKEFWKDWLQTKCQVTDLKLEAGALPKLVRDNIPEIIVKGGLGVTCTFPHDEGEYKSYLERKLLEEVIEYFESGATEELADILEVVFALAETIEVSEKQLMKMRKSKRKKNGAFKNGIILKQIDSDED